MTQRQIYKVAQLTLRKLYNLVYSIFHFYVTKESYPSIEATLIDLKRWGLDPDTAIDVGAYHGNWTRLFKKIFPTCKILMIEPQAEKKVLLQQVCNKYHGDVFIETKLLGSENNKEVEFVQMQTGSSVFEEASPYVRKRLKKTLVTLDSLIENYQNFKSIDFLKIDVQGYELEVLKGAQNLLQHTEFLLLEASLIPINQDAPLIFEVIEFMYKRDFRLLDFCSQIRRKDGALWQTDLLFIHNYSKFLPKAELDETNWG